MSIGTEEGNRIAIDIMNGDEMPEHFDEEHRTFWVNTKAEIEDIKKRGGTVDIRPEIASPLQN